MSSNMPDMSVTSAMSQVPRSWSNTDDPRNMLTMLVTAPVSHSPIGWLNAGVDANMPLMF